MKKDRSFFVAWLAIVFLFLVLGAVPAMAESLQQGEIPSFDEFLIWLSGPLVGSAVAVILSWIVEYWPKFDMLAPRYKRLIYFALCLVVPVCAAMLRAALGYVGWTFDPLIWSALWAGAAAAGVGTVFHARKLSATATPPECGN